MKTKKERPLISTGALIVSFLVIFLAVAAWLTVQTKNSCDKITQAYISVVTAEETLTVTLNDYYSFRDTISTNVDTWKEKDHQINGSYNLAIKGLNANWQSKSKMYETIAEETPQYVFKILSWING